MSLPIQSHSAAGELEDLEAGSMAASVLIPLILLVPSVLLAGVATALLVGAAMELEAGVAMALAVGAVMVLLAWVDMVLVASVMVVWVVLVGVAWAAGLDHLAVTFGRNIKNMFGRAVCEGVGKGASWPSEGTIEGNFTKDCHTVSGSNIGSDNSLTDQVPRWRPTKSEIRKSIYISVASFNEINQGL